jgi:glutamine synthetase
MGAELEFFLSPDDVEVPFESLQQQLQLRCKEASLPEIGLEKERGQSQYEVQVDHSANIIGVADAVVSLRAILTEEASRFNLQTVFDAKPYADQPGSSLHIHIGLFNAQGKNALMRVGQEPYREESNAMHYAIGGLLASMKESIAIFAPSIHDYTRFEPKYDAPTTVSWGGNNRTVALRIPASSWLMEPTRHIEHRVPSSNADPYLTIAAILAGIRYGVLEKIMPASPKIYGDASLPMYKLETFADSLEQAKQDYEQGSIVKRFFYEQAV